MQLKNVGKGHQAVAITTLVGTTLLGRAWAAPYVPQSDPFKVLDPQNWVNPDNMTWADYKTPPGTSWSDPSRKGSIRNFNIALVAVDYPDKPFVITQAPNSTVFGNPFPIVSGLNRTEVPAFYRDFLNKPSDLNHNHTLHEYWMEDSGGRFGVAWLLRESWHAARGLKAPVSGSGCAGDPSPASLHPSSPSSSHTRHPR